MNLTALAVIGGATTIVAVIVITPLLWLLRRRYVKNGLMRKDLRFTRVGTLITLVYSILLFRFEILYANSAGFPSGAHPNAEFTRFAMAWGTITVVAAVVAWVLAKAGYPFARLVLHDTR
ncbi:MAG: hypothetical protein ACRD3Q_22040 [Terriglobales bacterium]